MLFARFLLLYEVKVPLACTWIGIVMWFVARSVWLNQMQYVVWSCSRSSQLRIGRGEYQSGSQITGVVWWMTLSQWGSVGVVSHLWGFAVRRRWSTWFATESCAIVFHFADRHIGWIVRVRRAGRSRGNGLSSGETT